ncbi:hypothetical protein ACG7TL_007168 [Trametes sanguinea]
MHAKKAEIVPPSSFSEPSEPSQLRPEDKPAAALRGPQEENPQLVAHGKGRQAADGRSGGPAGGEGRKKEKKSGQVEEEREEARRVDEAKRRDGAGGFGVGRAKL